MERSRHVQVLLGLHDGWRVAWPFNNHGRVHFGLLCSCNVLFQVQSAHLHFSFKVNLGLLVTLLSVLDFLVSPVDEMIHCSDMVVSIVLNALLSVLLIKIELFYDLVEKLVLNRHLFFPWE